MTGPTNVPSAFDRFDDQWSPKAIAAMNDYLVKVVRVEGEFVWHVHEATDELFYVVEGELVIDLEGGETAALSAGDLFVVPAGLQHRPRAENEAKILLLEPADVVNTGDGAPVDMTADVEWLPDA